MNNRSKDRSRLGKQPPRFTFFLNPYTDARFTKCPRNHGGTKARKMPLVVHVDDYGLFVLNKECRFCPSCELVIVHQDEFESLLVAMIEKLSPEFVDNDYLVVGTLDRADWRRGAKGMLTTEETIDALHDFVNVVHFELSSGWGPAK